MALYKAIRSGREHRAEYRGSKGIDSSCRNHKSCPCCFGNRMYQSRKEFLKLMVDKAE